MCSEMTNTLSKGARKIEKCWMNSFIIINNYIKSDKWKICVKKKFIKFYKGLNIIKIHESLILLHIADKVKSSLLRAINCTRRPISYKVEGQWATVMKNSVAWHAWPSGSFVNVHGLLIFVNYVIVSKSGIFCNATIIRPF